MSGEIKFGERSAFIIGLATVLIALIPFKEELGSIEVNYFSYIVPLNGILLAITTLLVLSVYLSGVVYARGILSRWIELKWLGQIENIANILFILAVIFPIFAMVGWGLSLGFAFLVELVPALEYLNIREIIALTIPILMMILSYTMTKRATKRYTEELISRIDEKEKRYAVEGAKAYQEGYYPYMLIRLHESLVNQLNKQLIRKFNIRERQMSAPEIINLSYRNGVITGKERNFLMEMRNLRNMVAHARNPELTKDEAEEILDKSKNLLRKLERT